MSPRKRKGDLADIRGVLEDVLASEGFKRPYSKICVSWKEIVGEQVAEHTSPSRLENRVLRVKVQNSLWANELSFMKPDILERLEKLLGPDIVKDVTFKVVAL